MDPTDPVELARALIRCPSVTPEDAGALALVADVLRQLGFVVHDLPFTEPGGATIRNLYARHGQGGPFVLFAGHTDVVPPGEAAAWRDPPFAAAVHSGRLWGRGAADMKSGVAAEIAAVARFLRDEPGADGSIGLMLTGDEEGRAIAGTRKVLAWMREHRELPDFCVLAEPTSVERCGDTIKIGRRGSLNGTLTVHGKQGHIAYPERADNPVHRLVRMLAALLAAPLDDGSAHFDPSSLEISTVDVGNPTGNLIPARAVARFNIRYNDRHDRGSLERWLRARLAPVGGRYDLVLETSGDAFLTRPGPVTALVSAAVQEVTGKAPLPSTSGGTSDARFIKDLCPVVEVGLVGTTMHQIDESVALADIEQLTRIFQAVLRQHLRRRP